MSMAGRQPFFGGQERIERLRAVLDIWEGTPYEVGAAVFQGGGDCVRSIDAIYRDCGWPGSVRWPSYRATGESVERFLGALRGVEQLRELAEGELAQSGDLLAAVNRRRGNPHAAILADDWVWNMSDVHGWSCRHRQVAERGWQVLAVFRPVEGREVTHD